MSPISPNQKDDGSIQGPDIEQLEFLNTLIDTIPTPIFYKNTDGIYLNCNKAFFQFLGVTREDIIGKTVFDIAPKDIADIYFEKDNELFKNPGVQEYESKVKTKDGEEKDVVFHKATFFDAQGNMVGLIGSIWDITERRKAEAEREQLIQKLQKALDDIKTLKGLLPICASCKKIRDDAGYWHQIETYIRKHSDADFTHSICPDCMKKLYPEYQEKNIE